ncbi:hypothetical protein QOZ80_6BG0459700 [Eleusine coracana subsp. coracana]|nr:hypothetical protein QOZ80_6BG0459700 [Eleusine coracana subsp. coracana]
MPDPGEEVGPSGTRDLWQFQIPFGEQRIENVFSNAEGGFRGNLPPVAPQDRLATRCRKSPSPVVTEDLQPQPPPSKKPVVDVVGSASTLIWQEPATSSLGEFSETKLLDESIKPVQPFQSKLRVVTPDKPLTCPRFVRRDQACQALWSLAAEDQQQPHPSSEKPVAEFAESALPEPDISSSEELLVTKSLEGLITASPPTILVNAIASSSSTSPFSHEKLEAGAADSSFALTLQEPDASSLEEVLDTTSVEELITVNPQTVPHNAQDGSPPTASSFGSKIFFRHPPGWYLVYFIRIDRAGSFWMYPDHLGGPFHSLHEAESAISRHLDELQHTSKLKEQNISPLDVMIHNHLYYPDGTPKIGPNSRRRKETVVEEYYLVQALVNQYNDDHNLSGNFAHELENLLGYSWIYAENRWYYHFNFTTKTREAEPSSGYLFFAEMSHMQGEDAWEISCCCTINSKDNGLCYGCKNYGRPDIQHPNNTKAYFGGHLDGYLPFGDEDELSGPDYDYDDEEAEERRLRDQFDDLDDPHALEKIYLRTVERHNLAR